MKIVYLLPIFIFKAFLAFSQSTIGSEPFPKPPKGSSEVYSTVFATLIAVGVCRPGTDFEVYAQNEPSLGQQEIFWLVRVHAYDFQSIKFKKTIHLRCGNTIERYAEISNVKAGKVYKGTTFSGDPELSDLIFSEDCNLKTNRIQSVTISDVTGVMYPNDPANPEFQAKQIAIKNELLRKKQAAQQKTLDSLQTVKNNAAIAQKNQELLKQQQAQQAIAAQNQINQQARIVNTNRITQNLANQHQSNAQAAVTLSNTVTGIANLLILQSQQKSITKRNEQNAFYGRLEENSARNMEMVKNLINNRKIADSLFIAADYENAILNYVYNQYLTTYTSYYGFDSPNKWDNGKNKKGDVNGTKDYFLFKDTYTSSNAARWKEILIDKYILPEYYKIPLCKVYTNEPVRATEYENAFAFLRKCDECKTVDMNDLGIQSINYSKKIKDHFDEDSALLYLKQNVYTGVVNNPVDLLDYMNTAVWYNCLQSKHTRTIDDLIEGIKACVYFYQNITKWEKQLRTSKGTIYDFEYVDLSIDIIDYYFLNYYSQFALNIKNPKAVQWACTCVQKLVNRGLYVSSTNANKIEYFSFIRLYEGKVADEELKMFEQFYANPTFVNPILE